MHTTRYTFDIFNKAIILLLQDAQFCSKFKKKLRTMPGVDVFVFYVFYAKSGITFNLFLNFKQN